MDINDARGRHKDRVFAAALGFKVENARELKNAILDAVPHGECIMGELDFYGQRYRVNCNIKTGIGEAAVTTGWIVRRDENFPRLTTCFVKNVRRQK